MKWISEHRGAAIFCLILFLLAVLAIAARFYLSRRSDRGGPSVKRGKNRGEGSPETPAAPSKQQTANDFMYEKTLLEQRMAKCAGGKTGLTMLLNVIRSLPDSHLEHDSNKEAFRTKQAALRKYVDRYNELLERASVLPPEERAKLAPTKYLEEYEKLLRERV